MEKNVFLLVAIIFLTAQFGIAQKYITKNGHIKFYSDTPAEKIEAHNKQVNSALDTETGDFVFKILMKSFEFEKALMQEHFNENYVESHKYPNATFLGKITNLDEIDFTKEGTYNAYVKGKLSIHGVSREIEHEGTFTVNDSKIRGYSVFNILLENYDIKIPNAVITNIAESIEITVDVKLEELN